MCCACIFTAKCQFLAKNLSIPGGVPYIYIYIYIYMYIYYTSNTKRKNKKNNAARRRSDSPGLWLSMATPCGKTSLGVGRAHLFLVGSSVLPRTWQLTGTRSLQKKLLSRHLPTGAMLVGGKVPTPKRQPHSQSAENHYSLSMRMMKPKRGVGAIYFHPTGGATLLPTNL